MNRTTHALLTGALTAGLLLGSVPGISQVPSAYAQTTLSVTTDTNTIVAEGGYSSDGEALGGVPAFLTVADSQNRIIHADQLKTDTAGRYRFEWTMANDAPTGTYSVKVRIEGEERASTFSFTNSRTFDTFLPVALSPYRFTGELNAGQSQAVLYDKDNGLTISSAQGRSNVDVNLYTAQNAVRSAYSSDSSTNYLTISVPTRDLDAVVTVPGGVVRQMLTSFGEDAHLLVAAEAGSYDLPLAALEPSILTGVKEGTNSDLTFSIRRLAANDAISYNINSQLNTLKATRVASPTEFAVTAHYNGQSIPIRDYGRNYVRYSIDLAGSKANHGGSYSALFRHPVNGELMTTPSALYQDYSGRGKLVISRPGNGIYAPINAFRTFADLNTPHRSYRDLEQLASRYVIRGRSETLFDLNGKITRAEFATLMIRALGLADKQGTSRFGDIPTATWYTDTVNIGATLGLINGYSSYAFGPHDNISREQMVTLLARGLQYVTERPYVDTVRVLGPVPKRDEISTWARDDMALAIQTGILVASDFPDFMWAGYTPQADATREEAGEMLYRLLAYLKLI